jgi:group I intron endonuclease
MRERFREHMKCGLGIDTPANNKLYQAMLKEGLSNFTFELLEECAAADLNEKERFYIDLYQSKDFGYNSQSGNK